jgi:hypothetical protein
MKTYLNMKKTLTLIALFLFVGVGATFAQDMNYFGEKISAKGAVSLEKAVALLGDNEEINVKVRSEISDCCVKKGCWMTLKNDEGKDVRVTFKDYGFLVPLDSHGKSTILEGRAYYKTTSVDELRHYAEDAGASKKEIKKIKEPKKELRFEAIGVIIYS